MQWTKIIVLWLSVYEGVGYLVSVNIYIVNKILYPFVLTIRPGFFQYFDSFLYFKYFTVISTKLCTISRKN